MITRILVIDTKAVLHAVKYSLGKHRLSHNEKHTFIIYGFLLKLQFLLRKTNADVIVYATDSDESHRKKIYSTYKENRNKKTEQQIELDSIAYPQFDEVIDKIIPKMGYRNIFGSTGFEADDIIASICKKYKRDEIVICSTDQDFYQLLNDNVCMFNAKTNKWYSNNDFIQEYGIEPKMWKRVKAMGGCSSDNVAGIPGVGEKTVIRFLNGELPKHHKTYKDIVSKEGKRIINRNKKLVILPFEGTPSFNILPDRPSEIKFRQICEEYGFKSILSDIRTWKKILRLR